MQAEAFVPAFLEAVHVTTARIRDRHPLGLDDLDDLARTSWTSC